MASRTDIPFNEFWRLAHAGLSLKEIAQELCVGSSTLSRWMAWNNITLLRSTEDYNVMVKYGYTNKEIARRWGVSLPALYQWRMGREGLIK